MVELVGEAVRGTAEQGLEFKSLIYQFYNPM